MCFNGTLLDLLGKQAIFRISSEVHYEITKGAHYKKTMPKKEVFMNQVFKINQTDLEDFHKVLLGAVRTREQESKGEVDNFVVMISSFLNSTRPVRNPLVYLSDDSKAFEGLLKEAATAFPYCAFWTSYDAVLFIYLSQRDFAFDMAKNAIQQVFNQSVPNDIRADQQKMKEKTKKRDLYLRLLETVQKIKVNKVKL